MNLKPRQREGRPTARGAGRLALATVLCLALPAVLLNDGATGDVAAPTPPPVVPDQVLAELKAANHARGRWQEETQDWALEKEKLALLADTVRREAARLRDRARLDRNRQAELGKEAKQLDQLRRRLRDAEAVVDTLCERLEKATGALARRCLPGVVPPESAARITDPTERLAAAVARLEETDRRTRSAGVELVAGTLAGKEVTVRLLRAGGVAAWWVTLDGQAAGWARQIDGTLELTAAQTPADADAIRRALAMTEGRAAPNWVLLPLPPGTQPAREAE